MRVSTVFIGFALPAAMAIAKVLPQIDALAQSLPAGVSAQGAAKAFSASAQDGQAGLAAHAEPRLGVPTFLWGAQADRALALAARKPSPKARLDPAAAARAHLAELGHLYRLSAADVDGLRVFDQQSLENGATIVRMRNTVGGVEVFREQANLLLDGKRRLVSLSGYVMGSAMSSAPDGAAGVAANAPAAPTVRHGAPERAIATALADYGFGAAIGSQLRRGTSASGYDFYELPAGARSADGSRLAAPVRIKKVLFRLPQGLVPAWYMEVQTHDGTKPGVLDGYAYVVADADGAMLLRHNQTADLAFSYRVYAEASGLPMPSPHGRSNFPHQTGKPDGTYAQLVQPNLITLQNFPFSKNDPWLPPKATTTYGNNVQAFADLFFPDNIGTPDEFECDITVTPKTDFHACLSGPASFDYIYDHGLPATENKSQSMASVTNLFYTNNFLHDWFYDAGFNEAAGNAQDSNYGRGGLEGDSIFAEGQDFAGMNNANMYTPADGARPRMRMYLATGPTISKLDIYTPEGAAGSYKVNTATFGLQDFKIAGDIASTVPADACGYEPLQNGDSLKGKIAYIDRGNCAFSEKVWNAEQAGAVGVIIGNNRDGNVAPAMVGDDPGISIGVVSVSQDDAARLKANMEGLSGGIQRGNLPTRDGTLDNLIIAHEWGHYISNRLVGDGSGLGNIQGGGLGEGWGDFHAMLLLVKEGDAKLAANPNFNGAYPPGGYIDYGITGEYSGIRRYPYSSDLKINPLTLRHIENGVELPADPRPAFGADGSNNSEVHNLGEVWGSALWQCYSNLLRDTPRLSFDEAQRRMKGYLVAGYKLTPVSPTITEARDAILAAVKAQDERDFELCYQGFATRGIGAGARSADRHSTDNVGVVENFSVDGVEFVSATLAPGAFKCDGDGVLDNGETATLTVAVRNSGVATLRATSAKVTSDNPNVSFPAGQTVTFPASAAGQTVTGTLQVKLAGATGREAANLRVALADSAISYTPVAGEAGFALNYDEKPNQSVTDDVESSHTVWQPDTDADSKVRNQYLPQRLKVAPTETRWFIPSTVAKAQSWLASPPLKVDASGTFSFTFKHRFGFEADDTNYDGGVVEISNDGGKTWSQIPGEAMVNGYNGYITEPTNPLANSEAFVRDNLDSPNMEQVTVNLGSTYNGQTVQIRFLSASDNFGTSTGWEIDDISFQHIGNTPFDTLVSASACADRAIFAGRRADYSVSLTAAGAVVTDNVGKGGTQTLAPTVKRLTFADGMLALDIDGLPGQIARVYQVLLGRQASPVEMGAALAAAEKTGGKLDGLVALLGGGAEFASRFGAMSNQQFVAALYQVVLGRPLDRTGAFNVRALDTGYYSRLELLAGFADSPENMAKVQPLTANGIAYTPAR